MALSPVASLLRNGWKATPGTVPHSLDRSQISGAIRSSPLVNNEVSAPSFADRPYVWPPFPALTGASFSL